MIKPIAFYLPQYHPIPENDEWWGKGFTEWTNVTKAKPLFKGHEQPQLPSDLGFYDLRVPEVREEQAKLAREHGIYGFCYWHYWFGNGKKLLERPFSEVLDSGKPDFPFCLAWANETWTGVWHDLADNVLIEQVYGGAKDYLAYFNYLITAFKDTRYIKIDNKPVFVIYHPLEIPDLEVFITVFRNEIKKHGFEDIYLLGFTDTAYYNPHKIGLNGLIYSNFHHAVAQAEKQHDSIKVFNYEQIINYLIPTPAEPIEWYPVVFPNWDNSPRSKERSYIFKDSTPDLFKKHLQDAVNIVSNNEEKIVFIKSWNEWAEGNYLEPDIKYGKKYLETVNSVVMNSDDNETKDLVSILVPLYNKENQIADLIANIKRISYPFWECIIVDDGSTDKSYEVTTSVIKNDVRFKLSNQKNSGPSSARNKAFSLSKGDYLVTIDADDLFDVSFIEKALSVLKNNSEVGFVSCYTKVQHNKNFSIVKSHKDGGVENYTFNNNNTSFAMTRRNVWQEVGGFDEDIQSAFEDWDFWLKITKNNWKCHILKEPLFVYRKIENGRNNQHETMRPIHIKYLVEKHIDVFQSNVVNAIYQRDKYIAELNKQIELYTDKIKNFENEKNRIYNSNSYKIGNLLIKPFSFLKKKLK